MRINGQLVISPYESALQLLESRGIAVNANCREGYCGSCRVKANGEAKYFREPIGFLARDEVLPCCLSTSSDINLLV
ncbi:2Fe-2S iron-sulfur cluster-binding protein [uncultured Photobacterium sp.]|uniref:2Fe-2S iron-sulfur cluster-binding protein n=1 Tax=uncultured Photobacterium sp. TaxID=173973 RepID=UPI0026178138|nr:2Fe-2S iron-sulfur cluster-binding protein [uncultured Photobacterium sp.]